MTDNEIREAIERLKKDGYWGEKGSVEAFNLLISIAELYLQAAEGMPEERKYANVDADNPKDIVIPEDDRDYEPSFVEGFNQARALCIAAFARKMDEGRILKIIKESNLAYYAKNSEWEEELAQEIIREINGKE